MNISLQGFDTAYATFMLSGDCEAGKLVNVTADDTVSAAGAGDFAGLLVNGRDGKALVQLKGYAKLPYTPATGSSAPTMGYGYTTVASAADGQLTPATTGRSVLVIELDTTAKTCGVIL